MTQMTIQKQLDAITQATKEAGKTKETARQFLVDAGIVKQEPPKTTVYPVKTSPNR